MNYALSGMRVIVIVILAAMPVLLVLSAYAIIPDSNPYKGIMDRNVFSLKDPPPPPTPNPDANKPAPPPLTLTGITTLMGNKRAFLTFNLPGSKPGEAAKFTSLMLSEGQRDGEVEVIRIDEKARTVLVKNNGSETNLTFESNGAKGASSGPGAGTGAVATNPGMPMPAHSIFNPGMGAKSIPTRNVRLGGGMPTPPIQNSGVNPTQFTPGSGASEGMNSMFTPGSQPPQQQAQAEQQLTPAQQELLLEAAHQAALARKDPSAAVYPPGFLDPKRNVVPGPNSPVVPGQQPTVPGSRPPGF